MIGKVWRTGLRLVYAVIALIGLSIALGAYPPAGTDGTIMLLVGAGLAVAGVGGVIWPQKIRSGSSGPE